MSAPSKEIVGFRLNQKKVLRDLIRHQAGTLEKALVEGVMNAVDAKAGSIHVDIENEKITIRDDGQGFRTREEIVNWFGTIGMEHDASEGKRFGRFRMGRGQMFRYGRNHWRTTTFAMEVDIQSPEWEDPEVAEPPFMIESGLENVEGCHITIDLFDPLFTADRLRLEDNFTRMIKYVDLPVFVNGKQVNKVPAEQKWDIETDDAYIRLRDSGGLDVYNDGIFVQTMSAYQLGSGGEVVSKGTFSGINYARNEIDSSDPKWKRIRELIRKRSEKKTEKKPRLTEDEQRFAAQQLTEGAYAEDRNYRINTLKVFRDVTGRSWDANGILRHLQRYNITTATAAPEGDVRGDKLMQRQMCFVFSEATLDMFRAESIEELLTKLEAIFKRHGSWWGEYLHPVALEVAAADINNKHQIIDDEDLTEREQFLLYFIRSTYARVMDVATRRTIMEPEDDEEPAPLYGRWREVQQARKEKTRRILAGESETAAGWTDGSTYIALRRDHIAKADTVEGFTYVAELLHHENTHLDPSSVQHTHTPEFYREFHDTMWRGGFVREFVKIALSTFPDAIRNAERRLTRQQARWVTQVERAEAQRDALYAKMSEADRALAKLEHTKAEIKRARHVIKHGAKPEEEAPPRDVEEDVVEAPQPAEAPEKAARRPTSAGARSAARLAAQMDFLAEPAPRGKRKRGA